MSAHSRTYWVKLYVELINDEKVGPLNDSAFRRFIECLCLAGETDEGGFLPPLKAMAWKLRLTESALSTDLSHLAANDLLELRVHSDGSERWFVTNFAKRQSPSTNADRQRQWRQRNSDNSTVTKSYTAVTPETETETETEGGDRARKATRPAKPSPAPPPPVVKTHIPDRTPGQNGNGYHPPADPPPQGKPAEPEPTEEFIPAEIEMVNTLVEVTGKDGHWFFREHLAAARRLLEAYTAEQVRRHYAQQESPIGWNWYTHDWRGKKGDWPRHSDIYETISGAVATVAAASAPKKKLDPLLRALEFLGPAPRPATS